jgi:DNA-binding Xre family transcriptional regulator
MKQRIQSEFIGQDFDDFLHEDGIAAEVEVIAIKKVVVALLQSAGMTQVELAERLQTSRTQVRRLLDPENTSITLSTLQRTADVTGHRLVIGFEPIKKHRATASAPRKASCQAVHA